VTADPPPSFQRAPHDREHPSGALRLASAFTAQRSTACVGLARTDVPSLGLRGPWEGSPLGTPRPLGNPSPIPYLHGPPRPQIRTGSLTPLDGRCQILTLIGTRAPRPKSSYLHRDLHADRLHAPSPATLLRRPAALLLPCASARRVTPVDSTATIHFRDTPIRLVSCYTLLSRFRLPWPLPSCPNGPTPFADANL